MKTYKITLSIDLPEYGEEYTCMWNGYGEQSAIAQAFLHFAHMGARRIEVLAIIEN